MPMSLSLALLLLYILVLLCVGALTGIIAIAYLFLKGSEREKCGDTLLVVATITVIVGLSAAPLMNYLKDRHELANLETPGVKSSVAGHADGLANLIAEARVAAKMKETMPNLLWLPKFLELPEEATARKNLAAYFAGLKADEHRHFSLALREAIFARSQGKSDELFKEYDALAAQQNARISGEEAQLEELVKKIYKPYVADYLKQNEARIEAFLPKGFYRYTLLEALYTTAHSQDKLTQLKAEEADNTLLRMKKLLAGFVTSVVFAVVGGGSLVALGIMWKKKRLFAQAPDLDDPLKACTFKRLYAMCLMVMYCSFALTMSIGFVLGLASRGQTNSVGNYIFLTSGESVISLSLLLLASHFMICKPLGTSLKEIVWRPTSTTIGGMILWATGAFCAMRGLLWVYGISLYYLFKSIPQSNSSLSEHLKVVAGNDNLQAIFMLWLASSVVVPVLEELGFRRFLYGVLRQRSGILPSTLLSSAIFAAFHMDPNVFVWHFSLGAALALTYEQNRSLIPCILLHSFWNTSVLVFMWLYA